MKAMLLMSAGLLSLSAWAELYVQVNGVVTAARVPFGPWAEVRVGDPASMIFAVPEQGDVLHSGHLDGYPILTKTFAMVIDDLAVGLGNSPVPPSVFVSDDYPIADAFVMAPDTIPMSEFGYGLLFELHDSTGTVWRSPALTCIPGTYLADSFDDKEWFVFVGAGGIALEVTELIVYPVLSSSASCSSRG